MDRYPLLGSAVEARTEPWVSKAARQFIEAPPVPPTCRPFVSGSMSRPPESVRCIYYSPSPHSDPPSDRAKGVIAIKGAEPLAHDFEELVAFKRTMVATMTLEGLALFEHKAPCVVAVKEAELEAGLALNVQLRHLEIYGAPAHIPLPLFIHRYDDETNKRLFELFRRHLSRQAIEAIKTLEFGVYGYYYPSYPLRVDQYAATLPKEVFSERLLALQEQLDPKRIIDSWVECFVRILYLGYLPSSLGSLATGSLIQTHNAVLDGGFVDADSLIKFEDLKDDKFFYDALQYSTVLLSTTVFQLLVSIKPEVHHPWRGESVAEAIVTKYVTSRIRHFLETESRPGLALDPRIVDYYDPTFSHAELLTKLKRLFPAPKNMSHAAEVPAFAGFLEDMIQSCK